MSLEESDDLNILDVEPVDHALEASSLPKFDMNLYKYSLTETHVKWLAKCYGNLADLHPRVVPEGMTMNGLPNDAIGLYAHHFQQGGLRFPFSSFFLKVFPTSGSIRSRFLPKDTLGEAASPAEHKDLPPNTGDIVIKQRYIPQVPDDKEKKRRKADANAAANVPGCKLSQANRVAGNKDAGKEGACKKRRSAQQQANTLLRFEALTEEHANLVYAYESCKDVKSRYKECEQVDRIKQLEEALRQSEADAHQLRLDREKYVVEAGEAFSLAISKGFIDGISIGRKDPEIQAILKATPNVNPTSSDIFMETYEKLFDKRYPYVDKVARMYLLDPSSLQNVMPDAIGPTPGGGPRDTSSASYAYMS
ncbi:hypothetical protein Tco_0826077 [Tanacetum coccineum]